LLAEFGFRSIWKRYSDRAAKIEPKTNIVDISKLKTVSTDANVSTASPSVDDQKDVNSSIATTTQPVSAKEITDGDKLDVGRLEAVRTAAGTKRPMSGSRIARKGSKTSLERGVAIKL
jgi:hypothetical protein